MLSNTWLETVRNCLIDLHCHTNASDGSLTPTELVELASNIGIFALSIADHDTLGGLEEAVKAGIERKLCVIPGIELSVNSPWGSLHLLGYFSNVKPYNLSQRITQIQSFREKRNPAIAKKLQEMGIPINFDDVVNAAGGQVIGRPHFAKIIVQMGAVSNSQEAFDKYLKNGAPAYVDRERLTIQEAIALIVSDNGIPVLAHPGLITVPDGFNFEDIVIAFKKMGGKGIEAYAPVHFKSLTNKLLGLANKYDLIITGGTDFHGETKPHLRPGIGEGNFLVPDELAITLLQAMGTTPDAYTSFL